MVLIKSFFKFVFWIVGIVGFYVFVLAFPLRDYVFQDFHKGTTLLLFTNENEARPCGGFLSAYGTLSLSPFNLELQDSYTLEEKNAKKSEFPLSAITPTQNFWDVGTSPDLEQCLNDFQNEYTRLTKKHVDNVLLIDFHSIERILQIQEKIIIDNNEISSDEFFATLSRSVANTDRHNETALKERKNPMKELANNLIQTALTNPIKAIKISNIIAEETDFGNIYSSTVSQKITPQKDDFVVLEWNLGGGKSSRYLQKKISISAYEQSLMKWDINVDFNAEHLGGNDEPLSQNWKGLFEIQFPEFLKQKNEYLKTEIQPGKSFKKSWSFKYKGELTSLNIFTQRGQKLLGDISVSVFPQQKIISKNLNIKENTGSFWGEIYSPRKQIKWETKGDLILPFVTMHEIIPTDALVGAKIKKEELIAFNNADLLAEIHFNEIVNLTPNFDVTIKDTDFINAKTDHPRFEKFLLLEDKKTLLLGFSQKQKQYNERFSITMMGIRDYWGNEIKEEERTLIDKNKK